MKLTQITVSYGVTQSLPSYSNTKPAITLTADLESGDDPAAVEAALWEHARQAVHAQVDLALEANDQAAKYSTEPRYQVMKTYWNEWDHRGETKPPQYVIILPNEINPSRDAYAQRLVHANYSGESRRLRYTHALAVAQEIIRNADDSPTLLDCSDGDLSRLEAALAVAVEAADAHTAT